MERNPLSKQRSPWEFDHHEDMPDPMGGIVPIRAWFHRRRVNDGTLWAIVNELPIGWHMSISFRDKRNKLTRYPTWDEIMHARDALLPEEIAFVMHMPLVEEYVAAHDTTFHIHEFPERGPRRGAGDVPRVREVAMPPVLDEDVAS
jgi:hypothetical protein